MTVLKTRACYRVPKSADSMGAAQIEIQAKKFFQGVLEKMFFIQSCQKHKKNEFFMKRFEFCSLKKFSEGGQKLV